VANYLIRMSQQEQSPCTEEKINGYKKTVQHNGNVSEVC
jgi:hypothetical protein